MICSHCGGVMRGSAGLSLDGVHHPLCHPDTGMDCYRLVTVFKHPVTGCPCRLSWTDTDVDQLLDAWMNGKAAPKELTDRLPYPPPEFFDRVMTRWTSRQG